MKNLLLATVIVLTPVAASAQNVRIMYPAPNENQLLDHRQYMNHNGETVHAPSRSQNGDMPVGATARCGDGSYCFSHSHSGTCSRHGGVMAWLN